MTASEFEAAWQEALDSPRKLGQVVSERMRSVYITSRPLAQAAGLSQTAILQIQHGRPTMASTRAKVYEALRSITTPAPRPAPIVLPDESWTYEPGAERIVRAAAAAFNVPPSVILSKSQEAPVVAARTAVVGLARARGWSDSHTGMVLDRDRTTVMYLRGNHNRDLFSDALYAESYRRAETLLTSPRAEVYLVAATSRERHDDR